MGIQINVKREIILMILEYLDYKQQMGMYSYLILLTINRLSTSKIYQEQVIDKYKAFFFIEASMFNYCGK
jgi:hypothetical protein